MKKGFTLIELLVVVLIIGILSAVALPQYQKAVKKSRVMSMLPVVRAFKDAQEIYYMANGKYARLFEDLDLQMPGGCKLLSIGNEFTCDNNWLYDNNLNPDPKGITIAYCPGLAQKTSGPCKNHQEYFRFFMYYDHSGKDKKYYCETYNTKGQEMCQMLEQIFSNEN